MLQTYMEKSSPKSKKLTLYILIRIASPVKVTKYHPLKLHRESKYNYYDQTFFSYHIIIIVINDTFIEQMCQRCQFEHSQVCETVRKTVDCGISLQLPIVFLFNCYHTFANLQFFFTMH